MSEARAKQAATDDEHEDSTEDEAKDGDGHVHAVAHDGGSEAIGHGDGGKLGDSKGQER